MSGDGTLPHAHCVKSESEHEKFENSIKFENLTSAKLFLVGPFCHDSRIIAHLYQTTFIESILLFNEQGSDKMCVYSVPVLLQRYWLGVINLECEVTWTWFASESRQFYTNINMCLPQVRPNQLSIELCPLEFFFHNFRTKNKHVHVWLVQWVQMSFFLFRSHVKRKTTDRSLHIVFFSSLFCISNINTSGKIYWKFVQLTLLHIGKCIRTRKEK